MIKEDPSNTTLSIAASKRRLLVASGFGGKRDLKLSVKVE